MNPILVKTWVGLLNQALRVYLRPYNDFQSLYSLVLGDSSPVGIDIYTSSSS